MSILQNIYYSFIFLADQRFKEKSDYIEKILVVFKLLMAFVPVAYFLNIIQLWFYTNKEFVSGFIVIVIINAWVGIKRHRKLNTFCWVQFYKKTGIMLAAVIGTYVMLSIVSGIAGDNFVANTFKIGLQVTTLFYPVSKALKSIFILSNGEYPPKWIMKKVYNFEESGDLTELFKTPTNGE